MSIERFSGGQSEGQDEEPKLIIDEDWKTQVQREKELFKQKQSESIPASNTSSAGPSDAGPSDAGPIVTHADSNKAESFPESNQTKAQTQPDEAPPASFEYLVSGMATQALAAMGQIPDNDGNAYPVSLEFAKHYIDLLGVLETKTKGNLSDFEQRFLQDALHQLRMLFVAVKQG